MLTKPEIFKKAQEIIKNRKEEQQHIDICIQANICPECGEILKSEFHGQWITIEIKKCPSCKFKYKLSNLGCAGYGMGEDGGF